MADYDLVALGSLPAGGVNASDAPSGDSPGSGPETPDEEAQTASKHKQADEQASSQAQGAFDTTRQRRAFVAGLMANPTTALQQGALSSNLQ
jgi:hypothetical protein